MTKKLVPYDPNRRDDDSGAKPDQPNDHVHYHYYDQRTFVHGGDERDPESDVTADKPTLLPWQKVALGFVAVFFAVAAAVHFVNLAAPADGGSAFASAAPTSCLGHWSYAPSLEQAMDVFVTKTGDMDFNVVVTKMAAGDAANGFQNVSNINMMKDDTTVDGVVTKIILHDASRDNTLECRTSGAHLNYQGQTFVLQHSNADLKSVIAASGWQWPQAADPNKVVASACEGDWVLDNPEGSIAVSVERKDNFYEVSLLTQRNADSTRKYLATSGDANHLTVEWAKGHFAMTCSPQGAGAELGDGSPPIVMTRLTPYAYRRLLVEWMAINDANTEGQADDDAHNVAE